MEIMEYLCTHFLNKTQLLSAAQVSDEELRNYQAFDSSQSVLTS